MNTSQRWLSDDASEVGALAQSLRLPFSRKEAPNRFLKAAMTERLSSWSATDVRARGVPTQELVNVYRRWGEGGLGHILTGNVMVDYEHLDSPGSAVVAPDAPFSGARFTRFAEIARVAKAHGSLVSAQLSHPGRQIPQDIQPNPISSSDVQLEGNAMGGKCAKPHPATQQEIDDIVNRFTYAAEYMHRAGFDGVELLAAHGYLLAQFLSKSTNKRTDQYGGSLRNRARIIMEIASSIKKRIPSSAGFILGIKINSVEFQAGGFTADEARDLCVLLEQGEFDYVELSGGTWQALAFQHQHESSRKREAFFLEFADLIVPALTKTKVYVTGGFKTLSGMVEALATVDGVGLARPVCQEFDLAQKLLQGRVTGAIRSKVAEDSYGLQNVIAGSQIGQIGKGQEPTDMSNQGNLDAFMLEFEKWQRALVADTGRMPTLHGYVNLGPSEESTTTM